MENLPINLLDMHLSMYKLNTTGNHLKERKFNLRGHVSK